MELASLLGAIAAGIAIVSAGYKTVIWFKGRMNKKLAPEPVASAEESVAVRFVKLFEAHGVYRNQIPGFFGFGLTIADVQSEDALLKKLTPELLQQAAKLFAIEVEWLEHGLGDIFPSHHFYKQPVSFGKFIDDLMSEDSDKVIDGYVLTVKPPYVHEGDTLILLQESIGQIGDRTIFRYHLSPNWILSYWKCCADIACCIAQAQMRGVYLSGKYVEKDWLDRLACGDFLPEYSFEMSDIDLPSRGWWQTDEFVDIPEKFIKPLDKQDGYSVPSAIDRWLRYCEEGKIYIHSERVNKQACAAFRKEGQKYGLDSATIAE